MLENYETLDIVDGVLFDTILKMQNIGFCLFYINYLGINNFF